MIQRLQKEFPQGKDLYGRVGKGFFFGEGDDVATGVGQIAGRMGEGADFPFAGGGILKALAGLEQMRLILFTPDEIDLMSLCCLIVTGVESAPPEGEENQIFQKSAPVGRLSGRVGLKHTIVDQINFFGVHLPFGFGAGPEREGEEEVCVAQVTDKGVEVILADTKTTTFEGLIEFMDAQSCRRGGEDVVQQGTEGLRHWTRCVVRGHRGGRRHRHNSV